MKKILVPTAGLASAYETAEYVMKVARSIKAEVHVLHVMRDTSETEIGEASLKIFELASEEPGIHVVGSLRVGEVVAEIIDYAEQNQIDLILMGASNGEVVEQWVSYDVLGHTGIPVLVLPFQVLSLGIHDQQV
jgi:nucleotide-binding universal stress UspA family protein